LENRYKKGNESDYRNIVTELSELKIPERIFVSQSAPDYVFYPINGEINVDVMKEIEDGSYTETDADYVNSIYAWNTENMVNDLAFEELSAKYAVESEPLLRVFKFKVSQKNALSYNSYFVIKNIENLEFKENYGEKSADGYKYITLTRGANEIVFTTTENVNFENVPAFISPGLSKLSVVDSEDILPGDETTFPIKTFLWVIVIVLIIGIAAYIGLHMWYKKRYEEHLFKNKNDLYNLLHFIDSQRKKEVNEREIHEKLKKSGWNSEQIKLAMRKHSGKKTGMPGLSIW
jgi:hypothetical protein